MNRTSTEQQSVSGCSLQLTDGTVRGLMFYLSCFPFVSKVVTGLGKDLMVRMQTLTIFGDELESWYNLLW